MVVYSLVDLSERSIRAELVREDVSASYHSQATLSKEYLTSNQAIITGLDLEESQ